MRITSNRRGIVFAVAAAISALVGYLAWDMRPTAAEQIAAKLRVGMTPEEATEATGQPRWIFGNTTSPSRFLLDESHLVAEFTVPPHRLVAVHTYRQTPYQRLARTLRRLPQLPQLPLGDYPELGVNWPLVIP
jgi:hypothetical protein